MEEHQFKLNNGETELVVGRSGRISPKPFFQLIAINLRSNKDATVKTNDSKSAYP